MSGTSGNIGRDFTVSSLFDEVRHRSSESTARKARVLGLPLRMTPVARGLSGAASTSFLEIEKSGRGHAPPPAGHGMTSLWWAAEMSRDGLLPHTAEEAYHDRRYLSFTAAHRNLGLRLTAEEIGPRAAGIRREFTSPGPRCILS